MSKQQTNVGVKYNYARFCTGPRIGLLCVFMLNDRWHANVVSILTLAASILLWLILLHFLFSCIKYSCQNKNILQRYTSLKGSFVILCIAISWFLSPIQPYMVTTPFSINLHWFFFYSLLVRLDYVSVEFQPLLGPLSPYRVTPMSQGRI